MSTPNAASPSAPRALLSVSDKAGLAEFAAGLASLGFELVSTGGTKRALESAGLSVLDVSDVTGFPEMMDGRVKTLHPKVHGGLLGRLAIDADVMQQHDIRAIDLVCVNLYPFEETIAGEGVTIEDAIEQIDIGGPSMLRSAAKNHARVTVVIQPSQYDDVLAALREGRCDAAMRRRLAAAVFERTATYDRAIADYFASQLSSDAESSEGHEGAESAADLTLELTLRSTLRYGENPHQWAAFYTEPDPPKTSLAAAEQRNGKELSYNNLIDVDAALQIVRDFKQPACCVIKHTNPCGCATGDELAQVFLDAYAGDPVSAFGSILGFNRQLDVATAEALCEPGRFIEAIIAPGYEPAAIDLLTTKPKWKANVRLLELPSMLDERVGAKTFRSVTGGLLAQDLDDRPDDEAAWHVASERNPSTEEQRALAFVWAAVRHVKSNAIALAQNTATGAMLVGVGAGQMSRLDSSMIAARKAGDRAAGSVLGSDAFFPFRDGVDQAAEAGVRAIIQPGGSRNDDEVIAACNEHGIAMVMTGTRHFRH